ncbi:uncharacterized protein N7483_003998 [Penicillium malachiteum]|uniref:uncharacterized protein n=1 Tax=Penicillium malachiteum TaxID=1324776 RepID=UPI0025480685|nr:uncharacterized protein N7483_003998 [Penicillium malachiteum]KAJ5729490.1 hypothetical protein N7483_003998 [Penicillium malachiteum]
MGRSEPPFLYDRPGTYTFSGPTDPVFNPKAVMQASRTPASPRQQPKGPLVNFNRHPDSWATLDEKKPKWEPMNPRTKSWVKGVRWTQVFLRSITLLGALASLFCSIVVKDVATTVVWIIRAGPIVAVLHTVYAIYHFCHSPLTRPPASQGSYAVFAGVMDVGLIPFYVYTALMAHSDYTADEYHWGTLFANSQITVDIIEAMFICAVVNSGLHLVSFCLSIFLAVVFHKISRLPPDMNPLEDNLTCRPRRSIRSEGDKEEKHMSSSTMNTYLGDALMGSPRTIAFMHTRTESLGGETLHDSVDMSYDKRQSQPQITVQPAHRLSHLEASSPSSPDTYFDHSLHQPYDFPSSSMPAAEYRNVPSRSPNIVEPGTHTRQLASRTADRSNSVSPVSGNWVQYPDREESPVSELHAQHQQNDSMSLRQSSSVYSRRTDKSATSAANGIRDWFAFPQRNANAPSIRTAITEDIRGEYASLTEQEYYGNEEDQKEQDLGDQQRFNVFPDPEEHDHDNDGEPSGDLPFNPPDAEPTYTPAQSSPKPQVYVPLETDEASDYPPVAKNRYYGDLEADGQGVLSTTRDPSVEIKSKPSKLVKKQSKKMAAYRSLKKDDSDDEGYLSTSIVSSPMPNEGDRKGRVVSNSGADTGMMGGVGTSLSNYGSYLAGLGVGVGRRRDVSGKVAEEGRGGKSVEVRPSPSPNPTPNQSPGGPVRAAGWARFAGL